MKFLQESSNLLCIISKGIFKVLAKIWIPSKIFGKARFHARSLQGSEKEFISLKGCWKGPICSQDSCWEYFVLQGPLKVFMDFEGSPDESLKYKDLALSFQGIKNSQPRVVLVGYIYEFLEL